MYSILLVSNTNAFGRAGLHPEGMFDSSSTSVRQALVHLKAPSEKNGLFLFSGSLEEKSIPM
ncbi:hypothetical protein [Algoriphagus marincola]|uniref:hypothetical protein n=1 Tax=Algoriphagus marincola TaxID=264027 RepID=UPI0012DF1F46|nr:hypothetical protein [Algoriphagus marincola]